MQLKADLERLTALLAFTDATDADDATLAGQTAIFTAPMRNLVDAHFLVAEAALLQPSVSVYFHGHHVALGAVRAALEAGISH